MRLDSPSEPAAVLLGSGPSRRRNTAFSSATATLKDIQSLYRIPMANGMLDHVLSILCTTIHPSQRPWAMAHLAKPVVSVESGHGQMCTLRLERWPALASGDTEEGHLDAVQTATIVMMGTLLYSEVHGPRPRPLFQGHTRVSSVVNIEGSDGACQIVKRTRISIRTSDDMDFVIN